MQINKKEILLIIIIITITLILGYFITFNKNNYNIFEKQINQNFDLNSKECELPCFLYITPHFTSMNKVYAYLDFLGFSDPVELPSRTNFNLFDENKNDYKIIFIFNQYLGIVSRMKIDISTGYDPMVNKPFVKYFPQHVVNENRKIEKVKFVLYPEYNRYLIAMILDNESIYYSYTGVFQDQKLCLPDDKIDTPSFYIIVDDIEEPKHTIYDELGPSIETMMSIEEVLGIDEQEFKNWIINNPNECLYINAFEE